MFEPFSVPPTRNRTGNEFFADFGTNLHTSAGLLTHGVVY